MEQKLSERDIRFLNGMGYAAKSKETSVIKTVTYSLENTILLFSEYCNL